MILAFSPFYFQDFGSSSLTSLNSFSGSLTISSSFIWSCGFLSCSVLYTIFLYLFLLSNLLDESQAGIKIARRNINNLRHADDTTLMAESEEELKSLLMKMKEESEKAGLILNIQKAKIMVSSPITSWQIDGKTRETVTDFIFLGSKIPADDDCSH